jgi:hypothetical protein
MIVVIIFASIICGDLSPVADSARLVLFMLIRRAGAEMDDEHHFAPE